MLKKAVWRYQPLQKRSVWILLALAFIDVGLTFNWSKFDFSILKTQIIYIGILVVAIIIGLILWHIKYKPIRDKALQLVKEIEGE